MPAGDQKSERIRDDADRITPAESGDAADHKPYVADDVRMPEFTWSAVLVGVILGIIFGASSLYLVLKVGMTVSASIPVAVLSITLFRAFSRAFGIRRTTILENNIVQTTGSAGESIAFGVGVTMPALMLLGFDMDITRVMVVSLLGGVLGILMMIPLRRAFIVQLHGRPGEKGKLLYPEGTACAAVLESGERGGTSGRTVFIGFGIAFVHKFATVSLHAMRETLGIPLTFFNRAAAIMTDMAPELLGVGYVIGLRVAAIMMAGAVIGNLVIVPAIATFGDYVPDPVPPATRSISQLDLSGIQASYLRYIGAGCVTAAGIISMVRTMPLILRSFASSLGGLRRGAVALGRRRTERDLSMRTVLLGSFALLVLMACFLFGELQRADVEGAVWKGILGAGLVLVFGFLFVTVSSRLTGEIGSSSNPISGMTIATLALTCGVFYLLGMTSPAESVIALSIGGVVCIASSNGGTTSQDLKTGFLVGGTPYLQQYAILIGAVTSALVIGFTLLVFNYAGTVYSEKNVPDITLTDEQYAGLSETVDYEGKTYKVWRPSRKAFPEVEPGKYYVDESQRPVVLEDPAVTGRLVKRDDGSDVKMKFDAPKTQVMGIIINGVLKQELNWGLVLIGAMLAVGLELCGVSSLAFAVGVYIPMQYTMPIFLGGLVRGLVELRTRPRGKDETVDEARAIAKSESGPGLLLASGYIAGGTLAGVVIAFMQLPFFAPDSAYAPGNKVTLQHEGAPVRGFVESVDAEQQSATVALEQPAETVNVSFSDLTKLPLIEQDWVPWAVFGALMAFLALVAMGKLLPSPPLEDEPEK
jgi:putative OPT family oligopeptide transporter